MPLTQQPGDQGSSSPEPQGSLCQPLSAMSWVFETRFSSKTQGLQEWSQWLGAFTGGMGD